MSKIVDTFTRWLSDNQSWIGVFENHDMGHPMLGHRIALCFDDAEWCNAVVGKTRAPDHPSIGGIGWRYILTCKAIDVEEAVAALDPA